MGLEKGIGEERRWFYPISGFVMGTAITVTGLWTMFYPHIQMHFGLDTTASIVLAATFSGIGSMIVGPPIAGVILDKYGPKINFIIAAISLITGHIFIMKMLLLTQWSVAMRLWYLGSFFVGLGCGFFGGTSPATIGKWFPDKVGTAMGFTVAGTSAGTIVYSPLVASYIKNHGFNGNIFLFFSVISAIFLIGIGLPFWKTPSSNWNPIFSKNTSNINTNITNNFSKDYTLKEAIFDKRFWILYICFTCASFSYMFFTQNVSLIIMEGLSSTMSKEDILSSVVPTFLSVSAISTLAGTFIWGIISDKLGGPWKTLWVVYLLPAILMGAFYLNYHSKILIFLIGAVFYFCGGGEPVIHYAIVPHVFGRKHLGKVMSVLNAFSVGVGVSVGPYVGAYIKDVTGGYYWALIIAIIVRLCGTCCAILGMRFDKIKRLD